MLTFDKDTSGFLLYSEVAVQKPLGELFPFFSEAANLEAITPKFLNFSILTPRPIVMQRGLIIDYKLCLYGITFKWQSEITAWEPPLRFVDEQRRGPYKYWIHEHSFEEKGGVTFVRDMVRYGVFGGSIVHELFVKEELRKIFSYRRERLLEVFLAADLSIDLSIAQILIEPLLPLGVTLGQASEREPLLIVFLRHSGCTFCRETLAKLAKARAEIEAKGVKIVLAHMSTDEDAKQFFGRYQLSDLPRIADPTRRIYKAFGLEHGTLSQLLGAKSLKRGFLQGKLWSHGIGLPEGDTFQMPGSFLLSMGKVIWKHLPESAAEEADINLNEVCSIA